MQYDVEFGDLRIYLYFCTCKSKEDLLSAKPVSSVYKGKMAEWSIATVLKTVEAHTSGGSNPSLSATFRKRLAASYAAGRLRIMKKV